jgi:2-C-methyl-D-erythritol 4-phosphate cytidylyltransferase
MKTAGIILAGGEGKRFGGKVPKQFARLGGKPIIEYSLSKMVGIVDEIIVVCHKDWLSFLKKYLKNNPSIQIVEGGTTRQLSVWNGLLALESRKLDAVAIHDGARPLFSKNILKKCLETALEKGSAIPVVPSHSTLAVIENQKMHHYLDRNQIFFIQTPQAFRFDLILEAHKKACENKVIHYTDDSQILQLVHQSAYSIEGEVENIKITSPLDLKIASEILKAAHKE